MSDLPASLDDVTLDWVNSVLADSPEFKDVSFVNMDKKIRDEFSGLLSDSAILNLKTDADHSYQMLIKIQASNEKQHAMACQFGFYDKEVKFYNLFADQVAANTPNVYFAQYDEPLGQVAILMEYLVNTYSQDVKEGMGLEEAKSAVSLLAGISAAYWDDHEALTFPWLPCIDSQLAEDTYGMVPQLYPVFKKRFRKVFTEKEIDTVKSCVDGMGWVLQQLIKSHRVLCHGDFWADNLLFYKDKSKGAVALDWQTLMVSAVGSDFVHLLTTSLTPENRRKWQDRLVDFYLDKLSDQGIQGYAREELIGDMKLSTIAKINYFVMGSSMADIENARIKFVNELFIKRIIAMIDDMDCLSMLPEH